MNKIQTTTAQVNRRTDVPSEDHNDLPFDAVLEAQKHARTSWTAVDKQRLSERAQADPELTGTDYLVFVGVLWHLNRDDGRCFPGLEAIAAKGKVSIASVKRSRKRLEARGHIQIVHGRRFHGSDAYLFPGKDTPASGQSELSSGQRKLSTAQSELSSGQSEPLSLLEKNPTEVTQINEPREKKEENSSSLLTLKQQGLVEKVLTEKARSFEDVRTAWEEIPGLEATRAPETLQELLRCDVEHVVTWLKAGSDQRVEAAVERTPGMLTSREYIAKYGLPKRLNKVDVESVPAPAPVQDTQVLPRVDIQTGEILLPGRYSDAAGWER